MLTVEKNVIEITAQPSDINIKTGETAIFTVAASDSILNYQWQASTDGGKTWKNSGLSGNKTANLKVAANASRNGYQFRCIVSGGSASEISESAKLLCGEYTVPDVIGLKEATASFRLLSEGFGNVKIEYAEDYTKTDGIVIGQNPEAGSYAAANEEIIITVCKNPALTVLFEGNSDEDIVTISTDNMIVYKGRTYGELPTAQRDYYYFDGWYTESEGGTKIEADTIVTATANHTLYAHWTLKDEWGSWSNWSDSALSVDSYEGDIVIYGWSGNYWYNQSTRQVVATPERTQYRYRDRIK